MSRHSSHHIVVLFCHQKLIVGYLYYPLTTQHCIITLSNQTIRNLGGVIIDKENDLQSMTVLIMNDKEIPIGTKKLKVVVAICLGILPISIKWLIDCESHNALLPTEPYQIKDAVLDFSFSKSILLRSNAQLTGGVLNGCEFFITKGVCSKEGMPTRDVFHFLVKTSGGTLLRTQQLEKNGGTLLRAQLLEKNVASRLVIISNSTLSPQFIALCHMRDEVIVTGKAFLHAIKIQQFQLTSNLPPVMHSSFNAKTSLGVDTLKMETPKMETPMRETNQADDQAKINADFEVNPSTASRNSSNDAKIAVTNVVDPSVIDPITSTSNATHSNFRDEFFHDRDIMVKQHFKERSDESTAKLVADKDEHVRTKICVKTVARSVSTHKEGAFDVGVVRMCKVGDRGTLCVHENPVDGIRRLSYRDGNGKKLFVSQDLNRFSHPSTVIKGNGGKEPVFYMGIVNCLQCHYHRYIFEFDCNAVLAFALGHIFYDNMAHLSEFFVQTIGIRSSGRQRLFLIIMSNVTYHA